MANNKCKARKESRILRTASRMFERSNKTASDVPFCYVSAQMLHSKTAHHKKKRTSRLHRFD